MAESLRTYWYLWLVLVVLIGVMIWALGKASKAVKKRQETMAKEAAEIERYKSLVAKYSVLTKEIAEDAEPCELTEGVTAAVQRQIEKAVHMDEEFNNIELWRKTVYALYYFSEDCETSLSFFFKNNGEPVLKLAVDCIDEIADSKLSNTVSRMYSMYDDNNESVSIDRKLIEELDERFKNIYDKEAFFSQIKTYIINNSDGC